MRDDRVLIIDDNEDLCTALALALARRGWVVHIATTAHAAFLHVRRHDPHVVILDINLPDLDGLRIARELRAGHLRTGTRIVGLTGDDKSETKKRAIDAGMDALLVKPIALETLCSYLDAGASRN